MNSFNKAMWNSFLKEKAFWCKMNVWKIVQNSIPRDSTQLWYCNPHFIEIICTQSICCNSAENAIKNQSIIKLQFILIIVLLTTCSHHSLMQHHESIVSSLKRLSYNNAIVLFSMIASTHHLVALIDLFRRLYKLKSHPPHTNF